VQRIFDTSVYADVNDAAACGGGGYMGCALNSANLEIVQYLFSRGFNPNFAKGQRPIFLALVDLGPFGQRDDFVVAAFTLFMERGVEIDLPTPFVTVRSQPPTILSYIMEKCWQPHQQYPRYDRLIHATVESNHPAKRTVQALAFESFGHIVEYQNSHPSAGDVANCKDMYNLVRNSWLQK
jgi:hypothetical protein